MTRHSPRAKRPRCKFCKGTGKAVQVRKVGLVGSTIREVVPCPKCHGSGLPS